MKIKRKKKLIQEQEQAKEKKYVEKIWQHKNFIAQIEKERADILKVKGPNIKFVQSLSDVRKEIDRLDTKLIKVKASISNKENEKKDKEKKKEAKRQRKKFLMSAQNKTPPSVRKVLEWNVENNQYSDFKEEKSYKNDGKSSKKETERQNSRKDKKKQKK